MIDVHVLARAARPGFDLVLAHRPAGDTWSLLIEGLWRPNEAHDGPQLDIQHLAACPCCIGSVALHVALARVIRRVKPMRLFVLAASDDREHLGRIETALADAQYRTHLRLITGAAQGFVLDPDTGFA